MKPELKLSRKSGTQAPQSLVVCIRLVAGILLGSVLGCRHEWSEPKEVTGCLPDGQTVDVGLSNGTTAPFRMAFNGFGCNSLAKADGDSVLHLRTAQSSDARQTHAALVLGPAYQTHFEVSCGVTTVHQNRAGSAPNPHEVGWLLWSYLDNDHFYYFAPKPNGWELGKRDPAFAGGQQFLATGNDPTFALHTRHEIRILQSGPTIDVWADGQHLTTFTDATNPYVAGRIGFYCEDSEVYFDHLGASS